MRMYSLTVLLSLAATSCTAQRAYRNNPRPYQGFQTFADTVPQSSSRFDRYFTDAGWDYGGVDLDWGLKKSAVKAAKATEEVNDRPDDARSSSDRSISSSSPSSEKISNV